MREKLREAVVPEPDSQLGIKHHQPLLHVVERCAEHGRGLGKLLLGAFQKREIAADAAIALKIARLVEHRQAGQRQIQRADAVALAHEPRVAKRQPRRKLLAECPPVIAGKVELAHLVDAPTDEVIAGIGGRKLRAGGHAGETELGIHFPKPVRRGLGIVAKPSCVLLGSAVSAVPGHALLRPKPLGREC